MWANRFPLTSSGRNTTRASLASLSSSAEIWYNLHHGLIHDRVRSGPRTYEGFLARFDAAALQDCDEARPVFEKSDVGQDVAINDEHVRQLAGFERAKFLVATHDLGAGLGGACDCLERRKPHVLDEEGCQTPT